MPLTKVQIISNAVSLLGKGVTISLINQPAIIGQAEQAYDLILPEVLSRYELRFATTVVQLSQLNGTPLPNYWSFAYALPGNFLKLWRLYPMTWDFEIYSNNQLWSNFDSQYQPLFIEYSFLVEPNRLSAPFCSYMAYEIAAYLALSSAQNVEYAKYLDSKAAIKLEQALASDSQNRPQISLQSAPMISRRYVSTFASG